MGHAAGSDGSAFVGVAIHISDGLLIGVYDFEAALSGFNGPLCWEAPHWQNYRIGHIS
jgi:hypothetical protein